MTDIKTILHYVATDKSTGKRRIFTTSKAARNWADKRDMAYGCYIVTVQPVYA